MIITRCAARDLHTVAPGAPERTCWRQFVAQGGDCKKSSIAPLNAIIIIIKCEKAKAYCTTICNPTYHIEFNLKLVDYVNVVKHANSIANCLCFLCKHV